jgi:hypothetical protein
VEQLQAMMASMVESVLSASDEEILQEAIRCPARASR